LTDKKIVTYTQKEYQNNAFGDFYKRQMDHWQDHLTGEFIARSLKPHELYGPISTEVPKPKLKRPKSTANLRKTQTVDTSSYSPPPAAFAPSTKIPRTPTNMSSLYTANALLASTPVEAHNSYSHYNKSSYNHATRLPEDSTNPDADHPPRRHPSFSNLASTKNEAGYVRLGELVAGRSGKEYEELPGPDMSASHTAYRKISHSTAWTPATREEKKYLGLAPLPEDERDRIPDYADDPRQTKWTSPTTEKRGFMNRADVQRSYAESRSREKANPFYF